MNNWENLSKPPVIAALFQIKYNASNLDLSDFLRFDALLRKEFPIRRDNINVGIDLQNSTFPLGISKISGTSDAKIGSYIYFSTDQKVKFEITQGTVTYIDERPYNGWDIFKESTLNSLMILSEILNQLEVIRISIRFINKFTLINFDNPQEYFNTLISSSSDNQMPYYLRQHGFRLILDVPETEITSIVNQNVEMIRNDNFVYILDIDVLDKQHFIFDNETISNNLEVLRTVKNNIFFSNLTQKTIDLCN